MSKQKFVKHINSAELKMGFIRVPTRYIDLFPTKKVKIKAYLNNEKGASSLVYDPKYQRIYGLSKFFDLASERDILEIQKLNDSRFILLLKTFK